MKPKNLYDWHKINQLPRWMKKGLGWFCPTELTQLCPKHGLYFYQHPHYLKGSWFEYLVVLSSREHNDYDSVLRRELPRQTYICTIKGFPEGSTDYLIKQLPLQVHSLKHALSAARADVHTINFLESAKGIRWRVLKVEQCNTSKQEI
jgi:hypothetical protein